MALLKAKRLNTSALARKLRQSNAVQVNLQPNLNRWSRGEAQTPEVKTLKPVADFFKVRIEAFYDPKVAASEAARLGLTGDIHDAEQVDIFTFSPQTEPSPESRDAAPGKNNNGEGMQVERDPLLVVLEHLDPANREKLFAIAVELLKHQPSPTADAKKKGAA